MTKKAHFSFNSKRGLGVMMLFPHQEELKCLVWHQKWVQPLEMSQLLWGNVLKFEAQVVVCSSAVLMNVNKG